MIGYQIDDDHVMYAEHIKVCYTPTAIEVAVLEGSNWYTYKLGEDIKKFVCDKFSLHA